KGGLPAYLEFEVPIDADYFTLEVNGHHIHQGLFDRARVPQSGPASATKAPPVAATPPPLPKTPPPLPAQTPPAKPPQTAPASVEEQWIELDLQDLSTKPLDVNIDLHKDEKDTP